MTSTTRQVNSPAQVLFASLIGTTIEFYDFYIYATAAVLVFPRLFFPSTDPNTAQLASLATFAIAFVARPLGSVLFGHYGDKIGRKATLVAALLTMGLSTVLIGLLPTYHSIGITASLLLALCRFGQGIGLGGEWGGAVLLATENAPPGKRAWYGMFPQLGAPIGFIFSGSTFLLLSKFLTEEQFFSYGWRIPFLASASLVAVGLYVRLTITETPIFAEAMKREDAKAKSQVPALTVFREHGKMLLLGTMISIVAYALFYAMSVFSLQHGVSKLGYTRDEFLVLQLIAILFFAATIPIAGILAESGRRRAMIWMVIGAIAYGFVMPTLFESGTAGTLIMLCLGFGLTGLVYGPLGTVLSELFPTNVRYTGSSIAFNTAGIVGASIGPYLATWLAQHYSLQYVGYYLSGVAVLSLLGLLATHETKDADLRH